MMIESLCHFIRLFATVTFLLIGFDLNTSTASTPAAISSSVSRTELEATSESVDTLINTVSGRVN